MQQEKIENIDAFLVSTIASQLEANPLDGMKNQKNYSEEKIKQNRKRMSPASWIRYLTLERRIV